MALTRSFRDTVAARAKHDVAFRAALFEEAVQAFIDGHMDDARSLLRDCINATIGFERLSAVTHKTSKSLMRMVGPSGNPRLDSLAAIFRAIQSEGMVQAHVTVEAHEQIVCEA